MGRLDAGWRFNLHDLAHTLLLLLLVSPLAELREGTALVALSQ
jgi:hypothetical protein